MTYSTCINRLTIGLLTSLLMACQSDGLIAVGNSQSFLPHLSQYGIFQGTPAHLVPANGYQLYELASTLFSDYAEKQRLIKLPTGTRLTAQGEGLPVFPTGTILVKTFFYYKDNRDTSRGKTILETRLLVKAEAGWNVATYLWDEAQQEASLVTSGLSKTVNWIAADGQPQVIAYHVPSNRECTTCHQSGGITQPIGPKVRNLNRPVVRAGQPLNQLDYLQQVGLMSPLVAASVLALPAYADNRVPLSERGRAYLDVNCAHCHNTRGAAADTKLYFGYELPYDQTTIAKHKEDVVHKVEKGSMPRLGTTVVDEPGLALLKVYINSLP
ncbi:hypothetical protein [Spirosoma endbachense]|uniref:Cytochrome c domain-containing protein n=1 Tax=Spirosoma endbachense TaxID=2666025 RepID=A0A6P1W122_9BACT|nr:hypothetical protein [Spirosoma endbachense]QHV99093.1 hypothetical protein GJR95_30600 [Spirosoma endbachense]